ncbi:MAG: PLP-dependent transferase [Clostridia bacterium]|nr:PLP-dependent transferase [Clostridia bacterium]
MKTPIVDFVKKYADAASLRLHMPGHKGEGALGFERYDITEIGGADSLYEADGIIAESERNASELFGCPTFYSAEGSSQCIRAMLYLACLGAKQAGRRPLIAAGRNAHKTFLSAAALLDFDILWLTGENTSYLSCTADAHSLEKTLAEAPQMPDAVYLTSPDYLGNTADIEGIAALCHRMGILCLVDNAHGAYLRFLPVSRHPIDCGADLCCDSAHKTLPVLTGGAYLHLSPEAAEKFAPLTKNALALFGSTSPSYLILASLDAANGYLAHGYREKLAAFAEKAESAKEKLRGYGYTICGTEPLKITIAAKPYGYTGTGLADCLLRENIVCEFADPDFLVLMVTPETGADGLERLVHALAAVPQKPTLWENPPAFAMPEQVLTVREAVFAPQEIVPAEECAGRILAVSSVGCPPAVPIVVSGERIDADALACFAYYGIENCTVVKENEMLPNKKSRRTDA